MKIILSLFFIVFVSLSVYSQNTDSVLFVKINQYRMNQGLKPLSYNRNADSLVRSHNLYMMSSDIISHVEISKKDTISPKKRLGANYNVENVAGSELPDKFILNGFLWSTSNDPITINYFADMAIESWKNSIQHKKNMLDENLTKGSARIYFDFKNYKFVADFIAYK